MEDPFSKEILVSYAPSDRDLARRLSQVLLDWFKQETWLREFDLDGGQLIANALDEAMGEAKWFILLLSSSATESGWVKQEANLATFRAIESEAFRIIVFKLDSSRIPKHLQTALRVAKIFSLEPRGDFEETCLEIADHIEQSGRIRPEAEVYVDRGEDADRFVLSGRRNPIIFVVGPAGIGKSAFCKRSISEKLHKRSLIIQLTRGHSIDLLSRQVLERCHISQPISNTPLDSGLLDLAFRAIEKRASKFFLFLDNAEDAIDADNFLLPYLEEFLSNFIMHPVKTHVVVAMTRLPNLSPALSAAVDFLRLEKINDIYIKESIDLWIEGLPHHAELLRSSDFKHLVEMASGFPLAAKMIASQLKAGRTAAQLLELGHKKQFELRFAAHMLRTANKDLTDLERLVLHALSTVREPMSIEDLTAVQEIGSHPLEHIHEAVWNLSNFLLVQHTGELLSLHKFLETYFADQMTHYGVRREKIATDFGRYSYNRALESNELLKEKLVGEGLAYDDESVAELSGMIMRYAVPAAHLLRSVGEDDLADQLPMHVMGTLREMVFYFYQEAKEYSTSLRYAARWLQINPNDVEIQLYQARCYRNLRGAEDLQRAHAVLRTLEGRGSSKYFRARLLREKGIVAEIEGDISTAKKYFKEGIALAPERYPDNHIGLAQVLLRESEDSSEYWREQDAVDQAISLLEYARDKSPIFDRFHLGIYIEALLRGGKTEQAIPLLKEALAERPDDARLNYRYAEVHRKAGRYEDAEKFARIALKNGAPKAELTLSNIYCSQALQAKENEDIERLHSLLKHARSRLDNFRPEFGNDMEVADGIKAKSYRIEGEWEKAEQVVLKYHDSTNPYTVYEQSKVDLHHAIELHNQGNSDEAQLRLTHVVDRLTRLEQLHSLPVPLYELQAEVRSIQEGFEADI
jgi:tetratricopeptide (TPR) repeat protein